MQSSSRLRQLWILSDSLQILHDIFCHYDAVSHQGPFENIIFFIFFNFWLRYWHPSVSPSVLMSDRPPTTTSRVCYCQPALAGAGAGAVEVRRAVVIGLSPWTGAIRLIAPRPAPALPAAVSHLRYSPRRSFRRLRSGSARSFVLAAIFSCLCHGYSQSSIGRPALIGNVSRVASQLCRVLRTCRGVDGGDGGGGSEDQRRVFSSCLTARASSLKE